MLFFLGLRLTYIFNLPTYETIENGSYAELSSRNSHTTAVAYHQNDKHSVQNRPGATQLILYLVTVVFGVMRTLVKSPFLKRFQKQDKIVPIV